jgi:hypothetical protein
MLRHSDEPPLQEQQLQQERTKAQSPETDVLVQVPTEINGVWHFPPRPPELPKFSHIWIRYPSCEKGRCLEFDIRHNPKVEEFLEDVKHRFAPELDSVPVGSMLLRYTPASYPFSLSDDIGSVTNCYEFPSDKTLYISVLWDYVSRFLCYMGFKD